MNVAPSEWSASDSRAYARGAQCASWLHSLVQRARARAREGNENDAVTNLSARLESLIVLDLSRVGRFCFSAGETVSASRARYCVARATRGLVLSFIRRAKRGALGK